MSLYELSLSVKQSGEHPINSAVPLAIVPDVCSLALCRTYLGYHLEDRIERALRRIVLRSDQIFPHFWRGVQVERDLDKIESMSVAGDCVDGRICNLECLILIALGTHTEWSSHVRLAYGEHTSSTTLARKALSSANKRSQGYESLLMTTSLIRKD